ncbi:MAG: hypothetical protein RW306_16445 [Geobacteraceae bacterium]|nr:hypothetical protein [Geobacteraceae bacterium]
MLRDMKTQTHLKPGQKGTKRLVDKYGDTLLCVRYRLDVVRGVRLKTVEIIVEEKSMRPHPIYRDDELVPVVVAYTEKMLRERLKAAGGKWNPEEKFWHVRYGKIRGDAELECRILPE